MKKPLITTDQLIFSTRRLLASVCGKTLEEASERDFYKCFSLAIRDALLPLWKASNTTYSSKEVRQIYYFSMEYLMGRALENNIINLQLSETINQALKKMEKTLPEVEEYEREAGLGSGGLGRLASCFLDSLATLNYPGHGYGLRYRFGIFSQEICNGYQLERADRWLSSTNPWEMKCLEDAVLIEFGGHLIMKTDISGHTRYILKGQETVRAVPFDTPIVGYSKNGKSTINTLRLWSAGEEPMNFGLVEYNQGEFQKAFKNNTITYVLYPDDRHQEGKILRLKQQFFLVSASLQDILKKFKRQYSKLSLLPQKAAFQINDTHPTLVIPELMRILTQEEGFSWNDAWTITKQVCSYTNHTLMPEALETWDVGIFKSLLPRQFEIIDRINKLLKAEIKANYPANENKVREMSIISNNVVKMAHLAVTGSHTVNGVAALHSELLKTKTLRNFNELHPNKFVNVTNGITPRRWLLKSNPALAKLITERIGDKWICNLHELDNLKKFANDEKFIKSFQEIKLENKIKLTRFIKDKNPYKDKKGQPLYTVEINPESLFDIQIKRLHEYKRQLMNVLHIIMLYQHLKEEPNLDIPPRTFIFGAKASAAYGMAKNIIKLINSVAHKLYHDSTTNKKLKLVFIENYNVSKAELLFPAANLSEQISTASMEASGTGNMKFALNGALTIGTDDGANVEMKEEIGEEAWPFSFGLSSQEILKLQASGEYNPRDIYNSNPKIKKALDSLIDGTFAETEEDSIPLQAIYHNLLNGFEGSIPDYFFVLKDLSDYCKTQEKVSALYKNYDAWTRLAILNMAAMGKFSTDISIKNYADKIWKLQACPIDDKILDDMRNKFSFAT